MKRSSSAPSTSDARAGFTLLEALVSLAIAGVLLSGIALVAVQALRNWDRGHSTIAAMEMLTSGLARLGTDLSLALPMRPPGSDERNLLFKGNETSMMFVAATGFGAGNRGVELLTLEVIPDPDGVALVRKRGTVASLAAAQIDPVVLMRGRMKVAFTYRAEDGTKTNDWSEKPELPASVEVEIRGASGAPIFPVAAVFPLPTRLAVECLKGAAATTAAASTTTARTTTAKKTETSEDAKDSDDDVCGDAESDGSSNSDSDGEAGTNGEAGAGTATGEQGSTPVSGGKGSPRKPRNKASDAGGASGERRRSAHLLEASDSARGA